MKNYVSNLCKIAIQAQWCAGDIGVHIDIDRCEPGSFRRCGLKSVTIRLCADMVAK